MNRSNDGIGAKSLAYDDGFQNDAGRHYRKRKSEPEGIADTETRALEEKGDRGIKKIEITALSLPDKSLNDQVLYSAPLKKRRVIHQISIEKVNAEPDQDGDAPRFNVCIRDTQARDREDCEIEHDLLYEKILRKAELWRKVLPDGGRPKTADDSEVIQKANLPWYTHRCLLTYAIAKDIGDKATIFLKIRSLLLYALKLLLLMISAFGTFTTESYYFSEAVSCALLKNCVFYNSEGQSNTFEGISNLVDVKTFINDCFKAALSKGLWEKVSVDSGVVLVTEPRFRQVRVKRRSCWVSLYDDIICHSPFSEESESKEPFGSGSSTGFVYTRSDDDVWFRGYYNSYNSHGFVYFLSDGDVINEGWVDTSTSAIFIDFTLYSGDANLFCVVQFLFEFPLTGRITSSHTSRAFYVSRYSTKWGHFLMATDIMFVFMNIVRTFKLFFNLMYFKWRIFRSVGLLFSCGTTFFCWYTTSCLVYRFFATEEFIEVHLKLGEFIDFQPILKVNVHCDSIIVLACLLVSFEVYGYINIDLMSHLKITLQACFKNIVVFTIAFSIIVWAYVQVAYLLFSHSLERYRTFARCFSELMKVQLGDLDYEGPRSVLRVIGPIFILVYIISVVFVFMNMFFAIINGTFTFVANNVDIEEESYTAFIAHCCRVLRVKYGKGYVPKTEEKKLTNSERIRNVLLDSGYSNLEIKMFFCRYIVDDALGVDEAVFGKMWNLPIPSERLGQLKALVHELEIAVDLLVYKADWLSQRIRHIQDTRLKKKKKSVLPVASMS